MSAANQVLFPSDSHFQDGLVYATRDIANDTFSPYQLTRDSGPHGGKDYMITVSTENAITINLPTDVVNGCENGRQYYITSAIQNPVSVTINGGDNLINGASSQSLGVGTESLQLMFANVTSEWHII
jgi:hypothetical protein